MPKLKKIDFNREYRFREHRGGLVNCVTCDNLTGGAGEKEEAFCKHERRFRKIKIAEYWEGCWGSKGTSYNIASKRVCDVYKSKPLPEGVNTPVLPEKHAILLGTQYRDPYHADPNCPYVIEELRMQKEGKTINIKKPDIDIVDLSEMVPGEVIRTICEMPCCESRLPFQISMIDRYRQSVGIKPDGTEPTKWVRNGIIKHEKKVAMTLEEAEAVFDLKKFNSPEFRGIHSKIIAASDYLHKSCNRLGSIPLSEAVNPVWFDYSYHILKDSLIGPDSGADFWVYHEKLFDIKKGLEKPIKDLEKIPEGLIPCIDTKGVFRSAHNCKRYCGRFGVFGIVKNLNDENLLSKGVSHFIEVGAIDFNGMDHLWGLFGNGFFGLERFDEQ